MKDFFRATLAKLILTVTLIVLSWVIPAYFYTSAAYQLLQRIAFFPVITFLPVFLDTDYVPWPSTYVLLFVELTWLYFLSCLFIRLAQQIRRHL
jgi:hypothetical protein